MSTGNLFLVFFACMAGGCTCYPVADSSEELLGQLKVSTHVVREVSVSVFAKKKFFYTNLKLIKKNSKYKITCSFRFA